LSQYVSGKRDFGKLAELGDIAEEGLKRQASNRTFGLTDVLSGVGGAAAGSGGGPLGSLVTGGLGVLGGKLTSRFGDQVSATGANRLAKILNAAQAGSGGGVGQTAALFSNATRSQSPMMSPALAKLSPEERLLLEKYADALGQEQSP
jgi:hypothetical protein